MNFILSGIQQVGIGVEDADKAWAWYRSHFGMDVPIFKDSATASLMKKYTAGIEEKRYAILAMNMQGGGGFEIWQYTSRTPSSSVFVAQTGDLGVYATKLKSHNITAAFKRLESKKAHLASPLVSAPDGRKHFYVYDPYNNLFEVIESGNWFKRNGIFTGGVAGCKIGVSDIGKAMAFYGSVLGYDVVISDKTAQFDDLHGLPGGDATFRRVLLRRSQMVTGAFSRLLGETELELVEVKDRTPRKIYEDRSWGDLGFIHVCFEIYGIEELARRCEKAGFAFTVDSRSSFEMGNAAGHFSYCEDPDGTLIEFVETHRVAIFEKFGWFLNLKKREHGKPLPNWMVNALSLNRVKD